MTQRLDGISKLKNCPTMGDDIRRAIAASRKVVIPVDADEVETDEEQAPIDSAAEASDLPERLALSEAAD
jgi:hypothetical protein